MISYRNAAGRYLFSLGREGVLRPLFQQNHHRAAAPKWGSLIQTAIGAAVILIYAAAGLDPPVQPFFWGGTGGFGALLLLTITSAAVFGYHLRNGSETYWREVIAPAAALTALLAIVTTATINLATLLGVPDTSLTRWALPAVYFAVTVLGLAWTAVLRRYRPSTCRAIGAGRQPRHRSNNQRRR